MRDWEIMQKSQFLGKCLRFFIFGFEWNRSSQLSSTINYTEIRSEYSSFEKFSHGNFIGKNRWSYYSLVAYWSIQNRIGTEILDDHTDSFSQSTNINRSSMATNHVRRNLPSLLHRLSRKETASLKKFRSQFKRFENQYFLYESSEQISIDEQSQSTNFVKQTLSIIRIVYFHAGIMEFSGAK